MKKKEAVFLALFNRGHQLYENYRSDNKKIDRFCFIPTVLMINRWDGKIGFPGGHIDTGESHLEALTRELKEEINFDLCDERPFFVSSIEAPNTFLHFYALEISSFSQLKEIVRGSLEAEHFGAEVTGVFLQHLKTYEGGKGLATLLDSGNLVFSVKEEIRLLLKSISREAEFSGTG